MTVSDRPDRFVALTVPRSDPTVAEFSLTLDGPWRPATVYPGGFVDEWRANEPAAWNRAVTEGVVPAGDQCILWNYFFDVDTPVPQAHLRLRSLRTNTTIQTHSIDLAVIGDVTVIDRRNVVDLCRGRLPSGWSLACSPVSTGVKSIHRVVTTRQVAVDREQPRTEVVDADLAPLHIGLNTRGWQRIYVGMEPYSPCRLWLTKQAVWYEIPNYLVDSPNTNDNIKSGEGDRLKQEFYVGCADLTHQDICISPGGARRWRDVSIRYIKLVPMSAAEVDHHRQVRERARNEGRTFAAYMEPCTPATHEPRISTMRDHIRNRVRQNVLRGSDEVFVHAIRIGSRAWYHSDVVDRLLEGPQDAANEHGWLNFMRWMRQGDPMVVAIQEARQAGLRILTDVGMNSTYSGAHLHYGVLTERFAAQHPEYHCPDLRGRFDSRLEPVREYAV